MVTEHHIQNRIRLLAAKMGITLFRNNIGFDPLNKVRYGLCKGSGDLIGIVPVTVTSDMVGQQIGVFVSIEVKRPNSRSRITKEQKNWQKFVRGCGGIAAVCWDPKQLYSIFQPQTESHDGRDNSSIVQ